MLLTKNTEFRIFNEFIICYNDHTIQVVTPLVLLLAAVVHTTGASFPFLLCYVHYIRQILVRQSRQLSGLTFQRQQSLFVCKESEIRI